jgi:hypothetical protein
MTKAEKDTLFDALRDAEDWQHSLSDAHYHKGPIAERCQKKIKKYKRLRQKIASDLGISMTTEIEDLVATTETKTIHEIKAMK